MSEEAGGVSEGTSETVSSGEIASRPDYVPEKFWDTESSSVRMEDVFKSYGEIEKSGRARADTMRKSILDEMASEKQANLPESYEARIPESLAESLPEDFNFEFNEEDPMFQWWNSYASENGISQEQFESGIGAYVQMQYMNNPDPSAEYAKLGESGEERAHHVGAWVDKTFSPETANALAGFATNAAAVTALEEIMALGGEPRFAPFMSDTGSVPTAKDAHDLQNSDAYWQTNHPDHQKTVDRVAKLWKLIDGQRV